MSFLQVSGIVKKEGSFSLAGIDLTLERYRKLAIIGETGSGKSTLLKIMAGLVQPDAGAVRFEGERVLGPYEKLIPGHKGIAYLSQHFELPNNYWLKDVLGFENKLSEQDAASLYAIGRIDHLLDRRTNQFSGGERQRIALTRALISAPKLLLLDEPFSNTDMIHKAMLKSVIADVTDRLGVTVMLVSHDPLDCLSWADEILAMDEGRIVQKGSPEELYLRPVSEYVAGLLGPYNLIGKRRIFVRPEHITVVRGWEAGFEGVVEKVSFWGAFYELIVKTADGRVLVRMGSCDYVKGDPIRIFPPPGANHSI